LLLLLLLLLQLVLLLLLLLLLLLYLLLAALQATSRGSRCSVRHALGRAAFGAMPSAPP